MFKQRVIILFKRCAVLLFNNRRAKDALSMEEFVKLLIAAFGQTCELKEVQPVALQRI
jgi:hypothetical protein